MNGRDTEKLAFLKHYGFGPEAMKQIKVCPQCGARAEPAQSFCRECGAELPGDTLYDTYRRSHPVCPQCDSAVPQAAEYCPCCGAKLEPSGTDGGRHRERGGSEAVCE